MSREKMKTVLIVLSLMEIVLGLCVQFVLRELVYFCYMVKLGGLNYSNCMSVQKLHLCDKCNFLPCLLFSKRLPWVSKLEFICFTSVKRAKCGIRSTLCCKT